MSQKNIHTNKLKQHKYTRKSINNKLKKVQIAGSLPQNCIDYSQPFYLIDVDGTIVKPEIGTGYKLDQSLINIIKNKNNLYFFTKMDKSFYTDLETTHFLLDPNEYKLFLRSYIIDELHSKNVNICGVITPSDVNHNPPIPSIHYNTYYSIKERDLRHRFFNELKSNNTINETDYNNKDKKVDTKNEMFAMTRDYFLSNKTDTIPRFIFIDDEIRQIMSVGLEALLSSNYGDAFKIKLVLVVDKTKEIDNTIFESIPFSDNRTELLDQLNKIYNIHRKTDDFILAIQEVFKNKTDLSFLDDTIKIKLVEFLNGYISQENLEKIYIKPKLPPPQQSPKLRMIVDSNGYYDDIEPVLNNLSNGYKDFKIDSIYSRKDRKRSRFDYNNVDDFKISDVVSYIDTKKFSIKYEIENFNTGKSEHPFLIYIDDNPEIGFRSDDEDDKLIIRTAKYDIDNKLMITPIIFQNIKDIKIDAFDYNDGINCIIIKLPKDQKGILGEGDDFIKKIQSLIVKIREKNKNLLFVTDFDCTITSIHLYYLLRSTKEPYNSLRNIYNTKDSNNKNNFLFSTDTGHLNGEGNKQRVNTLFKTIYEIYNSSLPQPATTPAVEPAVEPVVEPAPEPEPLSQNDNNEVKIIKQKIEDQKDITLDELSNFVHYLILSK